MYETVVIILVLFVVSAIPLSIIFYFLSRLWNYEQAVLDSKKHVMCPKCHNMVPLKYYRCDVCKTVNELIPTETEIHSRKCTRCCKPLPTSNRTGRQKLTAICPTPGCGGYLGKEAGVNDEIIIPIIGGPSTGKTAFMDAWIVSACQNLTQSYTISFPSVEYQSHAKQCVKYWKEGRKPQKTPIITPTCLGMDIAHQGLSKGWRVYMYDPAGEYFDESKNLMKFTYYDYMNGVIFLVDPFAIEQVSSKYNSHLRQAEGMGFQVADRKLDDICDRLIGSMKTYHELENDEYHYAYCAVVITKSDSFDLDEQIGQKAIESLMQEVSISFLDAMDKLCVKFLQDAGVGHVLAKLEEHFKEVRCFSVSSFGHMPDTGKSYKPERVELPFMWILDKVTKKQYKSKFRKILGKLFLLD